MNLNHRSGALLLSILLCIAYAMIGFQIQRTETISLICLYSGIFFLTWFLLSKTSIRPMQFFWIGIGIRCILLPAPPWLSQDYFRYFWDGHLLLEGMNPYQWKPMELLDQYSQGYMHSLYKGMGPLSNQNYSNYPPLHQGIFYLTAWLSGVNLIWNIIILKLLILTADIGTYVLSGKILTHLGISIHQRFLYFLNPLVIIEGTGNVHCEGVMVFFLVLAIYASMKNQWILTSLWLSLSVVTKLIPVLFLPLFVQKFSGSKKILFVFLFCSLCILTYLPLMYGNSILHFFQSVGLWLHTFEFNASLYYIYRWIGTYLIRYNPIAWYRFLMIPALIGIIMYVYFTKKIQSANNLPIQLTIILSAYLILTTTVHPWYLITLIGLSIFTSYRFIWIWSWVIILSYSAYQSVQFQEYAWLICIEYLIVFIVLIGDWKGFRYPTLFSRELSESDK